MKWLWKDVATLNEYRCSITYIRHIYCVKLSLSLNCSSILTFIYLLIHLFNKILYTVGPSNHYVGMIASSPDSISYIRQGPLEKHKQKDVFLSRKVCRKKTEQMAKFADWIITMWGPRREGVTVWRPASLRLSRVPFEMGRRQGPGSKAIRTEFSCPTVFSF